jgi:hypothetical protein
MALKPQNQPLSFDISFFNNDTSCALNTTKAERGGIVCVTTVGSGAAMDQSAAVVGYAADASGKMPLGFLLNDVVNKDLTQTHLNKMTDEVQTGSKVTVCDKGWFNTNFIYPGATPAAGNAAYVSHSGYITPTRGTSGQTPLIGRFLSSKDEDGYAKVSINLPTQAIN